MFIEEKFEIAGTHNWTCPAGINQILVNGCGGGMGGGAVNNDWANYGNGPGGGSAHPVWEVLDVVPGTVYTLTIGAGGTGITPGGNTAKPGGSGGNTTFGTLYQWNGFRNNYEYGIDTVSNANIEAIYNSSSATDKTPIPAKLNRRAYPGAFFNSRFDSHNYGFGGFGVYLPQAKGGQGNNDKSNYTPTDGTLGAGGGATVFSQKAGDGGDGFIHIYYLQ